MSTARAMAAVEAWLQPPTYDQLPVYWSEVPRERPKDEDGRFVSFVLLDMEFMRGGFTYPGAPQGQLQQEVGTLRAYVLVPRGTDYLIRQGYADDLQPLLGNRRLPTTQPGEEVVTDHAAVVSGGVGQRLLADLADTHDVAMVATTFSFFHR